MSYQGHCVGTIIKLIGTFLMKNSNGVHINKFRIRSKDEYRERYYEYDVQVIGKFSIMDDLYVGQRVWIGSSQYHVLSKIHYIHVMYEQFRVIDKKGGTECQKFAENQS